MTSVAIWAGVDARAVSSLYIASDSRISWRDGAGRFDSWDNGRKVFSCLLQPHIFGFWGDVRFPALALPPLVERIDHGFLTGARSLEQRRRAVHGYLRYLLQTYPRTEQRDFGIAHCTRIGEGIRGRFGLSTYSYKASTTEWSIRDVSMPTSSSRLRFFGSGTDSLNVAEQAWQASSDAGTSRAVFGAFVDALASGVDQASGGAPQLVGLYRKGPGRAYGIVYDGGRYFAGAPVPDHMAAANAQVEWRDEIFELADPTTKRRRAGAQRHLRPGAATPSS